MLVESNLLFWDCIARLSKKQKWDIILKKRSKMIRTISSYLKIRIAHRSKSSNPKNEVNLKNRKRCSTTLKREVMFNDGLLDVCSYKIYNSCV